MSNRKRIGNVLLALGVLAWMPFLVMVAQGKDPSIFPFLFVHLTGVIGGSRLRAWGRADAGKESVRRYTAGRMLILLGVIAWLPYLYQKHVLDVEIEIGPYLAIHLTGVLSGIGLILSVFLARAWERVGQRRKASEEGL